MTPETLATIGETEMDTEKATAENTAGDIWSEIAASDYDWVVFEDPLMTDDEFVDGNKAVQVVFCADIGRAAVTHVGSGSGDALWTDAESIEDALRRYNNDDMAV